MHQQKIDPGIAARLGLHGPAGRGPAWLLLLALALIAVAAAAAVFWWRTGMADPAFRTQAARMGDLVVTVT